MRNGRSARAPDRTSRRPWRGLQRPPGSDRGYPNEARTCAAPAAPAAQRGAAGLRYCARGATCATRRAFPEQITDSAYLHDSAGGLSRCTYPTTLYSMVAVASSLVVNRIGWVAV